MTRAQQTGRLVMSVLWFAGVLVGIGALLGYSGRAGPQCAVSRHWPEQTSLQRDSSRLRLVVFLHPKCPCSRATVAELARFMSVAGDQLQATAAFLAPSDQDEGWSRGGLWDAAAAIPGIQAVSDADGGEAQRFGAQTSGHTLLFDRDGRLIFSGGITIARGHEGDNPGRSALERIVRGQPQAFLETPAFGCDLRDAQRVCDVEAGECRP